MRFNLGLSRQEFKWLFDYIGRSSEVEVAVPLYNRMKSDWHKSLTIADLNKVADKYQARMIEIRKEAEALEAELENKNAGAPVQGTG